MAEEKPFGGESVIEFAKQSDRRMFLRYASMVGVGGSLALAGVACSEEQNTTGTDNSANETESAPSPAETEDDEAKVPQGDLEILNYALTLEFLEADFYKQGIEANILKGRQLDLVKPIQEHEAAHVAALTATIKQLGGDPVAEPTFKYPPPTFKDPAAFLKTAHTFEELGVTAYHGQVTMIQTPDILAAAASIAGVESRHAAILSRMIGMQPFPAPVEGTKDMAAVLKAAKPFIKG